MSLISKSARVLANHRHRHSLLQVWESPQKRWGSLQPPKLRD